MRGVCRGARVRSQPGSGIELVRGEKSAIGDMLTSKACALGSICTFSLPLAFNLAQGLLGDQYTRIKICIGDVRQAWGGQSLHGS